ncbi:hypothetical protein [Scytonema hofmannii]|uniref:hypothetical protein n=1 Tax=Scytonema hofmannii TaxID=34078 RepID=UPI0011DF0C08|nr:hypothetical protein [Scytonema hofmannii]
MNFQGSVSAAWTRVQEMINSSIIMLPNKETLFPPSPHLPMFLKSSPTGGAPPATNERNTLSPTPHSQLPTPCFLKVI